ncbi:MAG: ribosome recycling factor [Clostridia bacterium]|nr:ribosome recycling factor [Clostridia bacterium]
MDYNNIEEKMKKAIAHLVEELTAIRAGRANPAILNKVMVDYYGAQTPINQVGSISVPEARQILITPWDKSLVAPIERAINMAELGINPINDGTSIRLNFPELNEERRKEIAKDVKSQGEDAKIAIRNIRRDAMEDAKAENKNGNLSEDELKQAEDKIQKITDKYTSQVDSEIAKKEKEVMEV